MYNSDIPFSFLISLILSPPFLVSSETIIQSNVSSMIGGPKGSVNSTF